MNKIIIQFLTTIYLFKLSQSAITDCLIDSGKNGKECGKKTTFISVSDWNFVVEDDLGYMCCYYKGYLGEEEYAGCFAFYEEDIKNYKVNDLLNEMEKGTWENALGIKNNNPSIDCSSKITKYSFNNIVFIIGIIIIEFIYN